ncbi:nuclear exosome regulator NRDE2 isoform X1 [Boleophthalmus pectinirostris]|uniref:nuclear exosome regulator NRDE2 isoform X1 n=1 Tax=Boleophthalmus pectinirostris TaxID=150288 RepID=UPI00242BE3F3|nr:nuclear exosome regulator NRDE2 isoform X1 [Boleophthalmus pectinirostris]
MALFPAFAEEVSVKAEDSPKEFDWLKNESFQTQDAVSIHCRFLEKTVGTQGATGSRDASSVEELDEDESKVHHKKKRKKSEKKKKKRKKLKKLRGHSDSSGSDSETIFPSDLKKEQDTDRPESDVFASKFIWLDDLTSAQKEAFCVDQKPDPANWTYKSLYRGDVARYRRKGASILGIDPHREGVTWDDSESNKKQKAKDKKNRGGGGFGDERYYSTANQRLLISESPVLLLPTETPENCINRGAPFLAFCDNKDNTIHNLSIDGSQSTLNPLGVYDPSTALWMQGKGKSDETDQKQDTQTTESSFVTKKTEDFNKRLREQPEDTELWIQFIHYQDELSTTVFIDEQRSDHTERSKSSYRAVLEKKLSIADRAVALNPSCISLQLERLKICQELWESSALAKEWKKLVFLHPNSAPLWKEYLLFMQSYFSNFSVSKVNSAFGKCLSTLSAVRDGSMVSHPALPGLEEDMLDIFIQQCHFLRQAGHSEKATSLFQAMIEFTFLKPESLQKLSTKQQVEFFETFWDSGEARVGEPGSKGWKTWMLQQERGGWVQPSAEEEEDEDEEEEEVKDQNQPRWKVWLDVESSREAGHWLPWRPDKSKGQTEDDCEDPDRQVLFDDIGQSMICLSSPDLQLRLLLHFLSFLGLPVNITTSNQTGMLLENLLLLTQNDNFARPLTFPELLHTGMNSVGQMTTLQGMPKCIGLGKQGGKFLNNIIAMIQPLLPTHHRAILFLSQIQNEKLKVLQSACSSNKKHIHSQGKKSKRIAKRLLKEPENRSSLEMWREYAHLEWLLGNLDEARKVFVTAAALGGTSGLASQSLCNLTLLWAQLETENALDIGGRQKDITSSPAVRILTRLAEGTSLSSSEQLSPVSILKARKSYDQALNCTLSTLDQVSLKQHDKGQSYRGLVGCYALFQYLTVGIKPASDVYALARNRMDELQQRLTGDLKSSEAGYKDLISNLSSECEALAIQQAALLRYHNKVSVFPLAQLRQMLTAALSTWPYCPALWGIYIQVENRYHSAGRARRFFHSIMRNATNVLPGLFAIVAEQQRKQTVDAAQRSCCHGSALPTLPENGLGHRIRGLFENATKTKMGAHCPLLWRMYMYFLVSDGKVDKAKEIFYKALQNVPWTKGLYMDAIQLFPEHLQEFVDLMTEKELRLRLPLEELDILLED